MGDAGELIWSSRQATWAEYVPGVVEAENCVTALDGIGCQSVLISATTEEVLEWTADALRSKALCFPHRNGPVI